MPRACAAPHARCSCPRHPHVRRWQGVQKKGGGGGVDGWCGAYHLEGDLSQQQHRDPQAAALVGVGFVRRPLLVRNEAPRRRRCRADDLRGARSSSGMRLLDAICSIGTAQGWGVGGGGVPVHPLTLRRGGGRTAAQALPCWRGHISGRCQDESPDRLQRWHGDGAGRPALGAPDAGKPSLLQLSMRAALGAASGGTVPDKACSAALREACSNGAHAGEEGGGEDGGSPGRRARAATRISGAAAPSRRRRWCCIWSCSR